MRRAQAERLGPRKGILDKPHGEIELADAVLSLALGPTCLIPTVSAASG